MASAQKPETARIVVFAMTSKLYSSAMTSKLESSVREAREKFARIAAAKRRIKVLDKPIPRIRRRPRLATRQKKIATGKFKIIEQTIEIDDDIVVTRKIFIPVGSKKQSKLKKLLKMKAH